MLMMTMTMIYCLRGDIVPDMMMMMTTTTMMMITMMTMMMLTDCPLGDIVLEMMMMMMTMMMITMMTMMMLTDCPLGDIVLEKVAEAVEHFPPPRNNFSFEKWKTFLLHRKMKKGKIQNKTIHVRWMSN